MSKTIPNKAQLIAELEILTSAFADLETASAKCQRTEVELRESEERYPSVSSRR